MSQPFPYEGLGIFSPKAFSFSIARKQLSLGSGGILGLRILGPGGKLVDGSEISAVLYRDVDFDESNAYEDEHPYGDPIKTWSGTEVKREETGTYSVELSPVHVAERGNYAVVWSYTVGDNALTFTDHLQVLEPMPTYDGLRQDEKAVVEQVSWMFADLFDSTNGGPHLLEPFQTHFGYERIAQLMHLAATRINVTAMPTTNYGVGEGSSRFPEIIRPFLVMGTYLEVIRHFVRSYVEQPNFTGMNVSYTDRRDYMQRWQTVLAEEKRDFEKALTQAKRKLLGLGRGALLVGGGIYGGGARGYFKGMYAAQTRSARFYPYASAIVVRR